jgi:predicted nucleic acid-binding protein
MLKKRKLRIVFDSVVLVSAFVTENGLTAGLLNKSVEESELYITEEILQETRQVLLEKKHLRSRFLYSGHRGRTFYRGIEN